MLIFTFLGQKTAKYSEGIVSHHQVVQYLSLVLAVFAVDTLFSV